MRSTMVSYVVSRIVSSLAAICRTRSSGTAFRLVLGGRVDKFDNLSAPKFSPRVVFIVKPAEDHSVTLSFNQAYRAPSVINNFLQTGIISLVDVSGLSPLRPAPLRPAVAQPFPLLVNAVGS